MTITFSQLGRQGRLGNQLWQIAATIATAKKYNLPYAFPKWEYEQYFNLHDCFMENIHVSKTYQEPHFHFATIPHFSDVDLSGYFQSYKYFADYKSLIKEVFEFNFPVEKNHETASIHVRRGDYLTVGNDYHTNLTENYYQQAISMVGAQKYFVFSDDIEWCKSHFRGDQFMFSQNNSPAMDLALMTNCDHNIIANSSFSWWGAYLNKNTNKKVIAPGSWFGYKLSHNTKDLIPNEWAII